MAYLGRWVAIYIFIRAFEIGKSTTFTATALSARCELFYSKILTKLETHRRNYFVFVKQYNKP